jgi:hypothetical protein
MSYKKWVYKYKYLEAECEEVEDRLQKYMVKFNNDFVFKKIEIPNPPPNIETPLEIEDKEIEEEADKEKKTPKKGRELYKKLSKKLHPDKGGNEDDFMSISEMYNEENILGMYIKAEELGIELEDVDLANIENTFDGSCIILEEKTNLKKKTLAWLWATCPPEKKENMKKMFIEKYKLEYRK